MATVIVTEQVPAAPAKFKINRFMTSVRNSLLGRHEWLDMISAAPHSLSKMGACCAAANYLHSGISLADAPLSEHGLRYTTLGASVAQVADVGLGAFEKAYKNMGLISGASLALSEAVEDITEDLKSLPSSKASSSLRLRSYLFRKSASECNTWAKEIEKEFADWNRLVMELRRAIIEKQKTVDEVVPVQLLQPAATSVPVLPEFPLAPPSLVTEMYAADKNDPIWAHVARIDAGMRRLYKVCRGTGETAGVEWSIVSTASTQAYIINLTQQMAHTPTPVSTTFKITASVARVENYITALTTRKEIYITQPSADWVNVILAQWAPVRYMVPVAEHHLNLSFPVNIWDPKDLMDMQFEVTTCPPTPLHPTHTPVPGTSSGSTALKNCEIALAELSNGISKIVRFFGAISCMGQHILGIHVRYFGEGVDAVVRQKEGLTDEQLLDIKHAGLIVQAYFFLNSSIANLYVDMHPTYVVPGLELLRELRWATTDDVCQQKNKLLDAYDKEMEYGLSVYMRNKQEETFLKAEDNLRALSSGYTLPEKDQDGFGSWD